MARLAFATDKTFDEQRRANAEAWRKHSKGMAAEHRKLRKIFHNDFQHIYSTGFPFGAGK